MVFLMHGIDHYSNVIDENKKKREEIVHFVYQK